MGKRSRRIRPTLWLGLAVVVIGFASDHAAAQVTAAQQSAIRSSCRSDFMSHCSGVTPGGKDALVCLQKNVGRLSSACKAAVTATLPPPPAAAAPAAAPAPADTAEAPAADQAPAQEAAQQAAPAQPTSAQPTSAQLSALRQSCRSDFMAKCPGVTPGDKQALACLQQNVASLSPACQTAVSAIGAPTAPAATAAPATSAPPAGARTAPRRTAAAAAAPAAPSAAQRNAMKQACRSDFMAKCSGVTPGGKDALVCLQRNVGTLSPACKQVVSATMGAPGAAATRAAVTPAAPAPQAPKAPLANAVVMLRACKLDLMRYCRGIEPGGGRELACLAAHESDLTIRCKMARKVTSRLR